MLRRYSGRSDFSGAAIVVVAAAAALTGCATTSQTADSRGPQGAAPLRGLVMPSAAMSELASGRPILTFRDWTSERNDAALHLKPSLQPQGLQWVGFWQHERLRITNGRPYESTTVNTRTWQLTPRR